jgi:hypothetical protein
MFLSEYIALRSQLPGTLMKTIFSVENMILTGLRIQVLFYIYVGAREGCSRWPGRIELTGAISDLATSYIHIFLFLNVSQYSVGGNLPMALMQ